MQSHRKIEITGLILLIEAAEEGTDEAWRREKRSTIHRYSKCI